MMGKTKILVLSDAHQSASFLEKALRLHRDASLVLFLGDGLRAFETALEDYPMMPSVCVSGNCDLFPMMAGQPVRREETFFEQNRKILMGHGHLWNVKTGREYAVLCARKAGADILLYGHTHQPETLFLPGENGEKPLYLMNPGAIELGSYGIIEFIGDQTVINTFSLWEGR
ncbi:MAG: metallophosphoesterase family protein [Clostridia bacterium]|nr:metallophosphoesterase family protein [Clostridia bacterium]